MSFVDGKAGFAMTTAPIGAAFLFLAEKDFPNSSVRGGRDGGGGFRLGYDVRSIEGKEDKKICEVVIAADGCCSRFKRHRRDAETQRKQKLGLVLFVQLKAYLMPGVRALREQRGSPAGPAMLRVQPFCREWSRSGKHGPPRIRGVQRPIRRERGRGFGFPAPGG